MVVSTAPIIIGNWPGDEKEEFYALIAFLGQVDVKVRGHVEKGDYLISSGKNDGYAVAVSYDDIKVDQLELVIGQSWEEHKIDEGKVNTLIGFSFQTNIINQKLEDLNVDFDVLKNENELLEKELQERYEKRQELIDELKSKVSMLGN